MAKQKRIMVKKAGSISKPKNKSAVAETKPQKFKGKDFDEWRKCFEASLSGEPAAREGFYGWIQIEEQIASKFEVPWRDDCRGHVLEVIHGSTSPCPALEEKTRKINNYTRTELRKLLSQLKGMADHLRSIGRIVTTPVIDVDMSGVLKSYEIAARETSETLKFIDSFSRQPKLIEQYMPLLATVTISGFPEKQIYALAYLAMKAHGYEDTDLVPLYYGKRRSGTARKHMKSIRDKAMILFAPLLNPPKGKP